MKQTLKDILAVYKVKQSRRRNIDYRESEYKFVNKRLPLFSDSIFFAGFSKEGLSIVSRQAFRSDNKHENWLAVNIPGEGIYSFENLSLPEGEGYQQGTLEYVCTEPGEKWKVKYKGKLHQAAKEELVELDVEWSAATPMIFVDELGASDVKLGKQFSRQEWSWKTLKQFEMLRQLNYEQAGKMTGTLRFKGRKYKLDFIGIRKHKRGQNNWRDPERHYWIAGLLENGYYFSINQTDYHFLKNIQSAIIYNIEGVNKIAELSALDKIDLDTSPYGPFHINVFENNLKHAKKLLIEPLTTFRYKVNEAYQIAQAETAFTFDGLKGIGILETGQKVKS
jgi:hypothetical protein